MAERNPPSWLQAGSHPAEHDRQLIQSLIGLEGVVDKAGGDLQVTEKATPDMSVNVARGRAFVAGTVSTNQGYYNVFNDATVNLAVAASDPTNPRKDIVVARVRDAAYEGANDDWLLQVVTGTPAATPSEPALPSNSIKLAVLDVAAGVTSVTNADITDSRAQAKNQLGPPGKAVLVGTSETTTSTSYTDLATVGPEVTIEVPASGVVLVGISGAMKDSDASSQALMSFAASGANTLSAADNRAISHDNPSSGGTPEFQSLGASFLLTGLTPGLTTFTAQYRKIAASGTATFANRRLFAIAL